MSIMILCGQDTGRQWYAGGEGGGSPGFAIVDGMGGGAQGLGAPAPVLLLPLLRVQHDQSTVKLRID